MCFFFFFFFFFLACVSDCSAPNKRPKGGWKHDAIQPEPEKDDVTPPWRLSAARRYPRSPAAKKLQLAQAEAAAQSAAQATAPSMSPLTSLPPMPSISPRSPQPTSNLMTSSSACSPRSPQSPDGSVNSTGSSSATSGSQASYSTSGSTLNGGMAPNNRRRRRPRKGNVAFGSGLVDVKHVADGEQPYVPYSIMGSNLHFLLYMSILSSFHVYSKSFLLTQTICSFAYLSSRVRFQAPSRTLQAPLAPAPSTTAPLLRPSSLRPPEPNTWKCSSCKSALQPLLFTTTTTT